MENRKGFRMTKTDETIIRRISENGFQSFLELRKDILKDYGRTSSWDLLKRLVRNRYLNECRGDGDRLLGWRINSRSQKVLSMLPIVDTPRPRAPVYRSSYDHDIALRSIRRSLLDCKAVQSWKAEHELKPEVCRRYALLSPELRGKKMGMIPDAVIRLALKDGVHNVALELELTQKSKKRLYEKIERYVVDPDFRMTLYIAKREHLFNLLQSIYREVLSTSTKAKVCRSRNGIYFATLEDLEANGKNTVFHGLRDKFTLSDLEK
jgi:hypothetical protein